MLLYLPQDENFLGLEAAHSDATAGIVIQPLPFERTTSYGKGTADGPRELLKASHYVEFYDDEFERELCFECGIATLDPLPLKKLSIPEALTLIHTRASAIIAANRFCVGIGGEHTISAPLIRAHAERYAELSVLQFDAHADLRNEYDGTPLSHACVMARVAEFLPPTRIVQVGIRALCREEAAFIKRHQMATFFASGIRQDRYGQDWIKRLVESLTGEVYLTFDVDALDPSIMPATGTPEPEGLSYSECIRIARAIVESGRRIVGLDVVELAPIKKLHHPNLTAARLVYKLLNIAFSHAQRRTARQSAGNGRKPRRTR
ncbi:MAG: agmatinase [Candidatus Kapaibacterium sp.]|nr:MAG: agmatinase [Candidatus Kapabacteria bacterium]